MLDKPEVPAVWPGHERGSRNGADLKIDMGFVTHGSWLPCQMRVVARQWVVSPRGGSP
jgi:hypothetical protein